MTRHTFGGDLTGWATDLGDNATSQSGQDGYLALYVPNAPITFWDAETGGNQYADLQDMLGAATTSVTTNTNGEIPQFRGPDGVWAMWADGSSDGTGPRRLIEANDAGTTLAAHDAAISDLQQQMVSVQALLAIAAMVVRENTDGTWSPRPDIIGDRTAWWVGADTPPIGGEYARDDVGAPDLYVDTQP